MPIALETFVKHLTESGIISPGKLESFIPPKAQPKDAQELARQLVQGKHLTKFQAQEVWSGRVKSLILGNYTILDKIGAGGMGQVFRAQHRRLDRIVAIKTLPRNVMKDAATVARFEREVKAAAKLRHPNIVATDDADEANGVHFLVMECIEGSDLSAIIKKDGPLSIAKAVNYTLQAARGLEFAHCEGVIHRDIKPANLLLDKKGTVKILDMGLARIEQGDGPAQAELTGTGAVMGTVDYMSPEQAFNTKNADARADVYSLGCTLHYLLTGRAVYDGESLIEKILAHREKPIPSLRDVQVDAPASLQAVFEKMVAKEVEDRYQTMSEVVTALEQCIVASPSSVSMQQPVGSGSSSDVMTFLRNIPANTTNKPRPTKKLAPAKSKKANTKLILGGVGAAFLGMAILAGVILMLRTRDGMLVVEINQPDAVVQVLNEEGKVEITEPGGKGTVSISIDPGKHRLKIEKDGFVIFGQDFSIESGGTQTIKATLEEEKPWFKPAFRQWEKEVAVLPAEEQVKAVVKKLIELNPKFAGKETHKIEGDVAIELRFDSTAIMDISPVRALAELKSLSCGSSLGVKGKSFDLSPLKGMKLTYLDIFAAQVSDLSPLRGLPLVSLICSRNAIVDLSPLQGMPLASLYAQETLIADLAPLKGMPLVFLDIGSTKVSDLSPLKGMMSLTSLYCYITPISDLTPLEGMNLGAFTFTPPNIRKGMDVIRQMKTLGGIGPWWEYVLPPDEFWRQYETGKFGKPPIITFLDPAFKKWEKEVAAFPVEKQVKAVSKKLDELNPGFAGKVTPKIEKGVVTELQIDADNLTDMSAIRALVSLARLDVAASAAGKSWLSDLSPLQGMKLTSLAFSWIPVADLTPLQGMPLTWLQIGDGKVTDLSPLVGLPIVNLDLGSNPVSDLSPLKGLPIKGLRLSNTKVTDLSPLRRMPLTTLHCSGTTVSDLSPLGGMPLRELNCCVTGVSDLSVVRGMPLESLNCNDTQISDLTPLEGMNLKKISVTPRSIKVGLDILRQMKSIEGIAINTEPQYWLPPVEFWKKYDAGDFSK